MSQLHKIEITQELMLKQISALTTAINILLPSRVNAKQAAGILGCSLPHLTTTIQNKFPYIIDTSANGQKKYILEKILYVRNEIQKIKILQA